MSTSYAPPPPSSVPPGRRRRRGGVVWPLLLIFVGVVFLLQNTGYLPPTFWSNLWRLWPLVLVLLGLELLLAQRLPWPALAALMAVVLIGGAAVMRTNMLAPAAEPGVSRSAQTQLGGASQAAVTIRFGAGQLNVGALEQPQTGELASMSYEGPPQLAPEPRYTTTSAGVGQLEYLSSGPGGPPGATHLDILLSPSVPLTSMNVQTGATQARLDLSSLHLSNLDLSIGASSAWLRLPEAAGVTTAHLSGGAASLQIEIPQGVAARIQIGGGLSTVNVDQSRFPQVSDTLYRSPEYDSAQNKVDLSIETGVTSIQIT